MHAKKSTKRNSKVSDTDIMEKVCRARRKNCEHQTADEKKQPYCVPREAENILFKERDVPYDHTVRVGIDMRTLQPYLHILLTDMSRGAVWGTDTYEQLTFDELEKITGRVFAHYTPSETGLVLFDIHRIPDRFIDRVCIDPQDSQPYRLCRFIMSKDQKTVEVAFPLTFYEAKQLSVLSPHIRYSEICDISHDNWREYVN